MKLSGCHVLAEDKTLDELWDTLGPIYLLHYRTRQVLVYHVWSYGQTTHPGLVLWASWGLRPTATGTSWSTNSPKLSLGLYTKAWARMVRRVQYHTLHTPINTFPTHVVRVYQAVSTVGDLDRGMFRGSRPETGEAG